MEEITLGGFLYRETWVIPVVLGLMIPLTGIVFGTLTNYWRRSRQAYVREHHLRLPKRYRAS